MITLHHLAYSRSLRVLWLLEELGVPYDLVPYARTDAFRAPPELARIHPLGKSPVIVDDDLVLAESSSILRYIHDRHGKGALTPQPGTDALARHDEWLDYVESSAVMPVIAFLRARMEDKGDDAIAAARKALDKTLAYIGDGLGENPWLMGDAVTLADMQMSYLLAMANAGGGLKDHPVLSSYLARMQTHPSFVRAVAIGGPMLPPDMFAGGR